MPLYDFSCSACGKRVERVFKVNECPRSLQCPVCHDLMLKVIISGHGGIQCDSMVDIPWLASAIEVLQPDHERPIETRGEYKTYLKDKNIIASG